MAKNNKNIIVSVGANTAEFNRAMKGLNTSMGSMQKQMANFGKMAAGAFSVGAVTAFASAALQASDEQQRANQKLLAALGGRVDVQQRLLAQAEEIRSNTGIDDAVINEVQAFAAAQGRSEAQIKKNTQAAVQLAAATGIDLLAAMKQVDATMEGNVGRLGKLDARFKDLTVTQLQNGDAVDIILEKYKGLAESQATDLQLLKSNWGEFQEQVGTALGVVMNPLLKEANVLLKGLNSPDMSWVDKLLAFTSAGGAAELQAKAKAMADIRKQMAADDSKAKGFVKNMTSLFPNIKAPAKKTGKKGAGGGKSKDKKEGNYWDDEVTSFWILSEALSKGLPEIADNTIKNLSERHQAFVDFNAMEMTEAMKAAEQLKMIEDEKNKYILQSFADSFGQVASVFAENTIAYKAFASAQALINTYLAATAAYAAALALGPAGLILAPIAAGLAIVAGLGNVAKINGVGLAEGGIVPGGYPNDTYPAMLTSGETVVPAKRLPDFQQQDIRVYGIIKAGDIHLSNQRGGYIANRRG